MQDIQSFVCPLEAGWSLRSASDPAVCKPPWLGLQEAGDTRITGEAVSTFKVALTVLHRCRTSFQGLSTGLLNTDALGQELQALLGHRILALLQNFGHCAEVVSQCAVEACYDCAGIKHRRRSCGRWRSWDDLRLWLAGLRGNRCPRHCACLKR